MIGITVVCITLVLNLILVVQGRQVLKGAAIALKQADRALALARKSFLYENRPVLDVVGAKWGGVDGKSVFDTGTTYSIALTLEASSANPVRHAFGMYRMYVDNSFVHEY